VFSAVVVTAVVSAAVSLSAMIVQASFRVGELEAQIVELAGREEVLAIDVAELSSPSRVARWADDRGMVMPTEVVTLTIRRGEAG
jgi:cell division protein FtsL